jgi:hypothetical protein
MRITIAALALATLLMLPAATVRAQDKAPEKKELVKYSEVEINDLLANFKATYKNAKVPEEDAQNVLVGLKDAYLYLASKGEEVTKEELKLKDEIVSAVSKGLFARKRARVNVECARALGIMGDEEAAKPLLKWMEDTVLDAKSPNADWVEYGFRSLAWVGSKKAKTLEFVRAYACGKHVDTNGASQALMAMVEWRDVPAKARKDWFNKVNQYLGGLYSLMRGTDQKKKGEAEAKYNTVKDNGLKALTALAGIDTPFADPDAATKWWNEGAKKSKWEDYIGPRFRTKPEAAKPDTPEKPDEAEKPAEPTKPE